MTATGAAMRQGPAPQPASGAPDGSHADQGAAMLDRLHREVLAEQGGAGLVDELATLAEPGGTQRALARRSSSELAPLVRACSMRLALDNVADEVRRAGELGGASDPDPLLNAHQQALDTAGAAALVDVRLVLTAHPTDIARRSVLTKQRTVADALELLRARPLGPRERERLEDEIREALAIWWGTSELRSMRPRVADEVRRKLWFFETSMFDAAGELASGCARLFGADGSSPQPPVRFASWAGGDMDGNPNVDASTILPTLAAHRRMALRLLGDRVKPLRAGFSQASPAVEAALELRESLARDERELPQAVAYLAAHYPHEAREPLRRKLAFVAARLDHTLAETRGERPAEPGYRNAEELLADLLAIRSSLGSGIVARGRIERLIWQVRIFGFHLATLEVRDNAPELHEACRVLLPGYAAAQSEPERVAVLTRACLDPAGPPRDTGPLPRAAMAFDAMADAISTYGNEALDTFIVSHTERPSDLLCALWLARRSGLFAPGTDDSDASGMQSSLELVPLFENRASLRDATETMAALYGNEAYGRHLRVRGRSSEVMIGYSDAGKDEGYLASQWTIYAAQERLADQARRHGVDLRLFHGRGGSPPRGGGPAHRLLHSHPPAALRGRLKVTEQGEVVTAKYAHPRIALRSLEQTVAAVVTASAGGVPEPGPAWRTEMERLAAAARGAYDQLVGDDELLTVLFRRCTPVEVLDELNIASRPAARAGRAGRAGLADLRAIPWVFAWMQTRIGLPSWYGAGTALAGGEPELHREMWTTWPFFRGLITTLAKSLAASDLAVGRRYLELAEGTERVQAERLWAVVSAEHARCVTALGAITGERQAPDPAPDVRATRARRAADLEALACMQVELLRRHRAGDPAAREPLLGTVAGIAAGLRTTG